MFFKNVWDFKDNGDRGMLARNPCTGEAGPMIDRNGTRDLTLYTMYKLGNVKGKKYFGSSVQNFELLQESLNKARRIIKRYKKIKGLI